MKIEGKKISFTQTEAFIAIILAVILVGLFFFQVDKTRLQNRDSKRIDDLTEIRQALRLYKLNNGHFPFIENPTIITGSDAFSEKLLNDLVVSKVFTDPIHPEFTYTYQSGPRGENYIIKFCLETNTIQNFIKGCNNTITP